MGDSYTNNRVVQISFDGSVKGDLSGSCKKLILTATEDCYASFNADTVTTSDGFFVKGGSTVEIALANVSKVSAIKSSSSGKLTILELF